MPFRSSGSRSSFSSSRSYGSSRSSSSWGSAKSSSSSWGSTESTPSKPVVNNYYNSTPAAKSYGGGYNSGGIGSSIAHGAASGVGAGIGYGVASSLFNGHSQPTTTIVQAAPAQPQYIPAAPVANPAVDDLYAQQQAQIAALQTQNMQMQYQALQQAGATPVATNPNNDSGFGFGSFLVVALIVGAVGYCIYKRKQKGVYA